MTDQRTPAAKSPRMCKPPARSPWVAYEVAKRDLDREQPHLTPAERTAALRAIANRLGL